MKFNMGKEAKLYFHNYRFNVELHSTGANIHDIRSYLSTILNSFDTYDYYTDEKEIDRIKILIMNAQYKIQKKIGVEPFWEIGELKK